jgi:HK97 family phage prohead protease
MIDGLCANLHKLATGATPGHAPGETHGSSHGHRAERAAMANKEPYGHVTYADPGYQKDGVKRYPIHTKANAKAAWSYINQADNASKYSADQLASIKGRIKAALKKFGVQISADAARWTIGIRWNNGIPLDEEPTPVVRSIPNPAELFAPRPFTRSYPLEDISIRAGGDGRTVEAYAAVFDTPAEIYDQDGHYMEELDRSAFNKAISDAAPQGSRAQWKIRVLYNHGMTLMGTPSDRHSMPVGVPVEIRAEPRGLLTVTRYSKTDLADEILESIREGSISGYSFSGAFRRSSPIKPRGGWRPDSAGNIPTVKRMESTLREYGPTPFPAYQEAAVVGMRMQQLLASMSPDEYEELVTMMRANTPEVREPSHADTGTSDEAAAVEPPAGTPERSNRDRMRQQRSEFVQRETGTVDSLGTPVRSIKGQMRANRSAWLQRHGGKRDE